MKPRLRREVAEWAQLAHQLSQRRVAGLIPVERGTLRYQHHRDRQEALRVRLRELAGSRVRYGYRRLTILLRREGWQVNRRPDTGGVRIFLVGHRRASCSGASSGTRKQHFIRLFA